MKSAPIQGNMNIVRMIETHLPEERKALAERRSKLEAELAALNEYDETLERIAKAMVGTPVLQLARAEA